MCVGGLRPPSADARQEEKAMTKEEEEEEEDGDRVETFDHVSRGWVWGGLNLIWVLRGS